MAFSVALAMALGKAAVGIGKGIKGHLQTKNAGSASLVDPTQTAMVNLMHRERRAIQTGTSDGAARGNLAKDAKNITRRSILGGKRDLSDYTKFRAANEKAIVEGRASERMGMLKSLTDETRNVADRKMDLVEQEGDRQRLYGQAAKQTASKNAMSQLPVLQELLEKQAGKSASPEAPAAEKTPAPQGEAGKSALGDGTEVVPGKKKKGKLGGMINSIIGGGENALETATGAGAGGII